MLFMMHKCPILPWNNKQFDNILFLQWLFPWCHFAPISPNRTLCTVCCCNIASTYTYLYLLFICRYPHANNRVPTHMFIEQQDDICDIFDRTAMQIIFMWPYLRFCRCKTGDWYSSVTNCSFFHTLQHHTFLYWMSYSGVVLCMLPASERRRHIATSSLVG